jgi:hypothetical protein
MASMDSTLSRRLSRRDWMRLCALGVSGSSLSGWLETLAADAAPHPDRRRACILLWMTGGPSQTDTFDMKPGHANGGPFQEISTSVPGIRISEHLPTVAQAMDDLTLIRSMSTREGDHTRATFLLRTGYLPQGPVQYPTLGSLLSRELGREESELPNFVSITPFRFFSPAAYGPGFLGPQYAPLVVGETGSQNYVNLDEDAFEEALRVPNLTRPDNIEDPRAASRLALFHEMESEFIARHRAAGPLSHQSAYRQAIRMMESSAVRAFELDEEPAALRDAYGRNRFGQGCLLARRLVERGVPFVEVSLNGVAGDIQANWDTHSNNFEAVKYLSSVLDPAWGTLLRDLRDRGLLESTLVVWMGEFGRTPGINASQGRDHYPAAWSVVLGGGGIRTGQVVGATSANGMTVTERPVAVPDLLATVCHALGIDPLKQNMSNVGRPIRIADPEAEPIQEILA